MKIERKILFLLFGAIILLIISFTALKIFLYESKAEENVENCMLLNKTMRLSEVVKIMGIPDNIRYYTTPIGQSNLKVMSYYYNTPSGSSVAVRVLFDAQTKEVVRIECDE